MARIESDDYHDYVIKDGEFVGEFEQMYQRIEDPWHCTRLAYTLDNDLVMAAVRHVAPDVKRALEVGCGVGSITARLAESLPSCELHACDVSPTAVRKAQAGNPRCHVFVFDVAGSASLPFGAGSLDLVVMVQVMWYILPVLERTLACFHDVLRPDGHLVLAQAFYPSADQKYGRGVLETTRDVRRYLDAAGFTLRSEVHVDPTDELGRPHNSLFWATRSA